MDTRTAKNNLRKGKKLEQEMAKRFRDIGFDKCKTSRYASRENDDNKCDLSYCVPFNVQCKSHVNFSNPIPVMESMPKDENYNVLIQRVKNKGTYAIMTMDDFMCLVEVLRSEGII